MVQISAYLINYRVLANSDVHPCLVGDGLDGADDGELGGEGAVATCDDSRASKRQRGSSSSADAKVKCLPVPTIRPVSANKDRTQNATSCQYRGFLYNEMSDSDSE